MISAIMYWTFQTEITAVALPPPHQQARSCKHLWFVTRYSFENILHASYYPCAFDCLCLIIKIIQCTKYFIHQHNSDCLYDIFIVKGVKYLLFFVFCFVEWNNERYSFIMIRFFFRYCYLTIVWSDCVNDVLMRWSLHNWYEGSIWNKLTFTWGKKHTHSQYVYCVDQSYL